MGRWTARGREAVEKLGAVRDFAPLENWALENGLAEQVRQAGN